MTTFATIFALFAALNSPFDYRYCDLSGVSTNGWHGDVLPLRATNDNCAVRMEDVAWLLEAVAERKALFKGETTYPAASKAISASVLEGVKDGLVYAASSGYGDMKTCQTSGWKRYDDLVCVRGPEVDQFDERLEYWYDFVNTAYGTEMVLTNAALTITNTWTRGDAITATNVLVLFAASQRGACVALNTEGGTAKLYAHGTTISVNASGTETSSEYEASFYTTAMKPWSCDGYRNYDGGPWIEKYGSSASGVKLLFIYSDVENIASQCETVTYVLPVKTHCRWFGDGEEVEKWYADALVATFTREHVGEEMYSDEDYNRIEEYARYTANIGNAKTTFGTFLRRGADKYHESTPDQDDSFVVFKGVLRATY